jgi:hypothetical protein
MNNRPFPIESLECEDAKFIGNRDTVKMFAVRVTNKEQFGVKDIRVRIGFIDTLGNPIDATVITLPGVIPPETTKLLTRTVEVGPLPPQWKSTFSILGAKRTSKGTNNSQKSRQ